MMPTYRLSTFTVPPGTIYLVGDNTSASIDSRHFGPVAISSIMGWVRNAPRPLGPLVYAAEPTQRERAGGTNPISQASIK
jgi:hypothetical protein